ncbi:MAG TPA: hypothetical protein PKA61_06245 [Nitrospira sp.]|nr:hypothetical protein [Nitrospira sp.]
MNWVTVTLILLFVTLPGCMMVREGKVKPPAQWPPQQAQSQKKSIGLIVAGALDPKGLTQMPRMETVESVRRQAFKAYSESGLFSSVVTSGDPTDLRADISVIEEEGSGPGVWAYLSALTFAMIPGYVSEQLIVSTSFSDRQMRPLDSVEQKEELGFWMQFFLLFTMPFTESTASLTQSVHYDMHRATIQEARGKGIF